ncbi:MAG: class I SAM-dependent methyltransferase [Ktedonobacteraceae bacterium]
MSELSDQHYLLTDQYNNAQKLEARIQLHQRFSTNTYDWQHWVFDHLTIPPESYILELGCGPADLWRKNTKRIPESWHITLSDFSPGMVQEARQYLSDSTQDFSFQQIDAQSIPFEDAHFDAVIANHMLYHVPDRAKALAEIRRVLKPGGHFYAATNGLDHLRELGELVIEFEPEVRDLWTLGDTSSSTFKFENGGPELAAHFAHVHLHHYENALVVTEAQPLVAFVLSTPVSKLFDAQKLMRFTVFIQQKLDTQGSIYITKNTGMFEAC